MERLVIVAEEKEIQMGRALLVRATAIAGQITAQNLASLISEEGLWVGERKRERAELVLWGRDKDKFTAAWTSRSPREEVVEYAVCENQGLVADVFSSESNLSLTEPSLQAASFTNLGDRRGEVIVAMRAAPLSIFGRCIGVLTWVDYAADPVRLGEKERETTQLALAFARFAEWKIMKACLGMEF